MNLELHNVGEVRLVVCERCGKPTATTATFSVAVSTSLRTIHHFTLTVCETCDAEEGG